MSKVKPAQFSVEQQLVFYGSYHSHPVNVGLHMVFIPIIFWSTQVFLAMIPIPESLQISGYTHVFNKFFVLVPNWAAFQTMFLFAYYFFLDPVAAILFLPHLAIALMTATAFSYRPDALSYAIPLNISAWMAQFIGHGFAEKRAPALMDNLAAAFVLAPFFVHLEVLFPLGYRPDLQRKVQQGVQVELKKFHKGDTGREIKD